MATRGATVDNNLLHERNPITPPSPSIQRVSTVTSPLDATIQIVTAENIAFEYRLAGPGRRLPAYLIDLAIQIVVVVGVGISLLILGGALPGLAFGLFLVIFFLVQWFYGGVFEAFMNGQTPGKRILGIRVLTVDGQPINAMQAVLRNLVRGADALPALGGVVPSFLVGLIAASCSGRYQRLGDLVAGTMVVIEERSWLTGVVRLEDPRAAQLAAYIPRNFAVSQSFARALAAYAERRSNLSPSRRREIAGTLAEPLLKRFSLAPDTSYDLLLCALYYRTFVTDRLEEERGADSRRREDSSPNFVAQGR